MKGRYSACREGSGSRTESTAFAKAGGAPSNRGPSLASRSLLPVAGSISSSSEHCPEDEDLFIGCKVKARLGLAKKRAERIIKRQGEDRPLQPWSP